MQAWEEQLLIRKGGEAYLAVEADRVVDDGCWALEDIGEHLALNHGDDIGWPDDETRVMLIEHDDLWQLDTTHREQLACCVATLRCEGGCRFHDHCSMRLGRFRQHSTESVGEPPRRVPGEPLVPPAELRVAQRGECVRGQRHQKAARVQVGS